MIGQVHSEVLLGWRRTAYAAIRDGVTPSRGVGESLFADLPQATVRASPLVLANARDALSQRSLFWRLAKSVACHRDEARWDALYAVLWRLAHGEAELIAVVTDPAVHRLVQMHRGVKRAAHKMKAFVRFRRVADDLGEHYVAWFEPVHDVVRRTAPFFAERFGSMRWSILTPDACAHWDLRALTFTPGLTRSAAPTDDALEELWRTYYASTFNPARLNTRMMQTEMPRRYWRNLPEARLIAELRARAPSRVTEMLAQVAAQPEILPTELEREVYVAPSEIQSGWDPIHDPGRWVAKQRAEAAEAETWCKLSIHDTPVEYGVAGWTDPSILVDGAFYPRGCVSPEARLRYYASRFPFVEVDSTYYALPARSTAALWASRTPEGFSFDVKAHALMTGHPTDRRRLPDWVRRELPTASAGGIRTYAQDLPREIIDEVWARFRSALDPLRTAGKLGAIMLQYPPWFAPTRNAADELRAAKERLGDDLATIEFRNRAWMEGRMAERTLGLLRELQLAYVIVDAPPGMESSMPPTIAVTDPRLAVFRLHGRRAETWEAKNDVVTERYRYLYDAEELQAWLPGIYETAFDVARVHVTFNNNHSNYATTNATESFAQLSAFRPH